MKQVLVQSTQDRHLQTHKHTTVMILALITSLQLTVVLCTPSPMILQHIVHSQFQLRMYLITPSLLSFFFSLSLSLTHTHTQNTRTHTHTHIHRKQHTHIHIIVGNTCRPFLVPLTISASAYTRGHSNRVSSRSTLLSSCSVMS